MFAVCWNVKAVSSKDMVCILKEITKALGRWDHIQQSEAHVGRAPEYSAPDMQNSHPQCYGPGPKVMHGTRDSIVYILKQINEQM